MRLESEQLRADAEAVVSDQDWVVRAQSGDKEAFDALMRRHQRRIFGVALSMMKNTDDAEEVVQETFLSAFEKLDGFRREAAFFSWIYRVATNHCLMRLRKKSPVLFDKPEKGDPDEVVFSATQFSPYETVLSHEVVSAIDEAVDTLSPEARDVLYLRVMGLKNREIADELGLTLPNVKTRLHRARAALRSEVDGGLER